MKHFHLQKVLITCVLCMMGTLNIWADSYFYKAVKADFTSENKSSFSFTNANVTWNVTEVGLTNYVSKSSQGKGLQIGSSASGLPSSLTLTTNSIQGNIQSIVIETSTNVDVNYSLSVLVGGIEVGKESLSSTNTAYTFTPTIALNGEICLKWNNVEKPAGPVNLKSITINYTVSSEPTNPSKVSVPVFSVDSKDFSDTFSLTLSTTEDAAKILYTTDGSDPSYKNNVGKEYASPISITHSTTIKAIAVSNEGEESNVAEKTYRLNLPAPSLNVGSSNFAEPFDVEISTSATASKYILYTLDGSDPKMDNKTSVVYRSPVNISATTILKAVSATSKGSDFEYSPITVATYTYKENATDEKIIWSEDFSKYKRDDKPTEGENAIYTSSNAKVYTGSYAGGESPEMILNSKGYFAAEITDLKGCKKGIILNFKSNDKRLSITISNATNLSEDIELISSDPKSPKYSITYIFALDDATQPIKIKIAHTYSGNVRIDDIELSKYEDIDYFTITDAGYATYYTSTAYTMPNGVTGYIITDNDGETLTMEELYTEGNVVPAKTALLIKGNAAKYAFLPTISEESAPLNNKLHGSDNSEITFVEGNNVLYYKFAYDDDGTSLGFYWDKEEGAAFENGAHKAYLALESKSMLSPQRGFTIAELNNNSTAISKTTCNDQSCIGNDIFSINGQRIKSLKDANKGIYIIKGHKILIK